MKDSSLYQQILGDTTPWKVSHVSLNVNKKVIEVTLNLDPAAIWACPKCCGRMHVKDWRERSWRHLDSCQFQTILTARVPIVECPLDGIQTVQVPWAEGSSRFTSHFERLAIEVMQACSTAQAGELLGISWAQCDGIKQRAIQRGKASLSFADLEYVCVDEKAVGHGHDYVTVVTGIIGGKPQVLHLGDGRGADGLDEFWHRLGKEGCQRIKAVSMDMHQPYVNSTRKHCFNAEIVFDPFHLMKMMNQTINEVRKMELAYGNATIREALRETRQLWLWGEENLPPKHAERFDELKKSSLKTARAWRLKEIWRTFKDCRDINDGNEFFDKWYRLAMRSGLEPVKRLARNMKDRFPHIVTYLKYRFCNAIAEGVNSQIQLLIQKSCGYRNRDRLKADILFHLGGLKLIPSFLQ